MKHLVLMFVLCSAAIAAEPFQPFVLGSKDWSQERMKKCLEDFDAAIKFEDPPNSKFVTQHYDGGTSEWKGDGYLITIKNSACSLGGIQGVAHGPVVTFDEKLATNPTATLSCVRFYEIEVYRAIIAKKK